MATGHINSYKFILSDVEGGPNNYTVKATFDDTANWGESRIWIAAGRVSTPPGEERNEASNVVGITYGPTISQPFTSCYEIKQSHKDYKSGLYYTTYDGQVGPTLTYCEQERAGGGWTLFYANSGNPKMEVKKSYNEYSNSKGFMSFDDNYWSYNLHGMVDYNLLGSAVSLMGVDLGSYWNEGEYGYITFSSNQALRAFLDLTLVQGTSCASLPNDDYFRYRNSNGVSYLVNSIMNWNSNGYGWQDCMANDIPDTAGSNVEAYPRHVIYMTNSNLDEQRTRGIFGFNNGASDTLARYFLRRSSASVSPSVDLMPNTPYVSTQVPVAITIAFSDSVSGLKSDGIECSNCKVLSVSQSPVNSAIWYADIEPEKFDTTTKMTVTIKANAAQTSEGKGNLVSSPMEITLSDDLQVIKFPSETKCPMWLDTWKSNSAGTMVAQFGVSAGSEFSVIFSPSNDMKGNYYKITLAGGNDLKTIKYIKHSGDEDKELKSEDVQITFGKGITLIWIKFDSDKFTVGTGITPGENEKSSCTDESDALSVQYASFCGSSYAIDYYYIFVGPKGSSTEMAVMLSSTSSSPTADPFTMTVTTSQNIQSYDKTKIMVGGSNQWISDVTIVNPRTMTFKVTPKVEKDGNVDIQVAAECFTDQTGVKSSASSAFRMVYQVSPLKLTFSVSSDVITSIPLTVTLTWNRATKDFDGSLYSISGYSCMIYDFNKISDTVSTILVVPQSEKLILEIYDDYFHDMNGNGCVYSRGEFDLTQVKTISVDANSKYFTWMDSWKSAQSGIAYAKFKAYTDTGISVVISSQKSLGGVRYTINLGWTDENGQPTINRIYKGDELLKEVSHNFDLTTTGTELFIYQDIGTKKLKIGNGTDIMSDKNTFITIDNTDGQVQYFSFGSNDNRITYEITEIGPKDSGSSPSCTIEVAVDTTKKISFIPLAVTIVFSREVVQFTKEKIDVSGGIFYEEMSVINATSYLVYLYPTRDSSSVTIMVPANAAIDKSTSIASTASNQIVYNLEDDITQVRVPKLNGEFKIFYKAFKFANTQKLDLMFKVFTPGGGVKVALLSSNTLGGNYYLFEFGDKSDSKNAISLVKADGTKTELATYDKQTVSPNTYITLWVSIDSGRIRMGSGDVVDLQPICDTTQLDIIPVSYFSFGSKNDEITYSNIVIGPVKSGFYVTLTADYKQPLDTFPVHVSAEWSEVAKDFSLSSISSTNCKFFNFYNKDNGKNRTFSFDVIFDGNNDCSFNIPQGKVHGPNSVNVASESIVIYHSTGIYNYEITSPNKNDYKIFYENWKSNSTNELYSTFSMNCKKDAFIGLAKDEKSEVIYQIVLGADDNTRVLVQRYNKKTGVSTTLGQTSSAVCAEGQYIDFWVKFYVSNSMRNIDIGSGSVVGSNYLVTGYDSKEDVTMQYITFANNEDNVYIKSILVGPGSGDTDPPKATVYTYTQGTFTTIPVDVYIEFSEPVTELEQSGIEVTNGKIVYFYGYSYYTIEVMPISTSKPITIKVKKGAVKDMTGNPSLESDTLTITFDPTAIFRYQMSESVTDKYLLWLEQWKATAAGNIEVSFSLIYAEDFCVGILSSPNDEYPIFDFCYNHNGVTGLVLRNVTGTEKTILKSLSVDFSNLYYGEEFYLSYSDDNNTIKFGQGSYTKHEILMEYNLVNVTNQPQYVSFTSSGNYATFYSIMVTPFTGGRPSVTIESLTPLPATVSPISMKATFTLAPATFSASSLTVSNGEIINLKGSGSIYTFDFLAYGNGTSTIQLLENAVYSRGRYGNIASTPVSVSYGDSITDYECPALYNNFVIKSPVWRTNSYGTLWTTFSVRCEEDFLIRFSPWLQGGFPNYLIKLGNRDNTITRVEAKKNYENIFDSKPMCNPYGYFDYWISQENSAISIGKGTTLNQNQLWKYEETQAVPSHYVSFSSTSTAVSYKNIKVGPSGSTTLECFLYSDVVFPTNITNIPIYVQWNQPVTDFNIGSIQSQYANVDNFEKLSDSGDFYKFIMTPSRCGFSSVYVKEGAVTVDGVPSKASLPLYSEYCNRKPVPSLTATTAHYSTSTPFTIRITFASTVYGFDIGDFEYPSTAWLLNFRSDSETSYILEVAPYGNATENVNIRVKADSLTDLYGNLNEASQTITLPLYNTIVDTFTVATSLYNDALFLKQWSTGLAMNTWITFNGRCTKDLFIAYAQDLESPDSERIRIIVGGAQNSRTQIVVRGVEVVNKPIGPCVPGVDVKMWARFEGRKIEFGTGDLGETVVASYEVTEDLPFKYIGLSNWNSPVYYRNIAIGPVDAIPPRTRITSNLRTQITSTNPIRINVTFTNDCTSFDPSKITFTEKGKISEVTPLSKKIYTFEYTGVEGENSIAVPQGVCNDSNNRPNDAASPYYYTYQAGILTGEFSTSVPSITATAPIPVTVTFSAVPTDFTINSITISGSDGYLGELVKVEDDQYSFNAYVTDTQATYLTIKPNTIHDSVRNENVQIGPFALPRYDASVTTFMCPENKNDLPYFVNQWTGVQRGNVNAKFRAKCTDGIIVGISQTMSPEDETGYIAFKLGMSNNKVSTISTGTKDYISKDVGFCNDNNDVDVWISYSNGKASAGTGTTVGTDTKIETTIPEAERYGYKFVYFSGHTSAITYSAINIGPSGITRPKLTVDTSRGSDGAIVAMMKLSSSGSVWCIALKNPSDTPSIIQMLRGSETKLTTEATSVVVTGLLGGTRYDLWCYAEDADGVSITNDNIETAKQTVTTSGSASYPIVTIKSIVGRSTSIYIEFELSMTGELYALAVISGISAPTIEKMKSSGTKQTYVYGNPASITLNNLKTQTSFDVYFYAQSIEGSQPQEEVDESKKTVRTDAICPIVDGKECAGNGKCNDGICECEYGYHDKDCSVTCPGTNFAGHVECAGHGTCQLTGKCQCDSSLYLGDGCNIQCPNDGIEACGGVSHGTCQFDGSKAWCECRDNWTGKQCTKQPRGPLGAGAIIGIICGCLVGLCIICIGGYCYCSGPSVATKSTKKSKKSKKSHHHDGDLLSEVA